MTLVHQEEPVDAVAGLSSFAGRLFAELNEGRPEAETETARCVDLLLQTCREAIAQSRCAAAQELLQPILVLYGRQQEYERLDGLCAEMQRQLGSLTAADAADDADADRAQLILYLRAQSLLCSVPLGRSWTEVSALAADLAALLDGLPQLPDQARHAAALGAEVSLLARLMNQDAAALSYYNMAKERYEDLGGYAELAALSYQHGLLLHQQADYQRARDWYQTSMDTLQNPDAAGTAGYRQTLHLLQGLGNVSHFMSQHADAESWYGHALRLANAEGDASDMGHAMHALGTVNHSRGDYDVAEEWYRSALGIWEALQPPDRYQMSDEFHHLGTLHQARGDFQEAEDWLLAAMEYRNQIGDWRGYGDECRQMGLLMHMQKRYDRAERWYRDAVSRYRELSDAVSAARTCGQLARLGEDNGSLDAAVAWLCLADRLASGLEAPELTDALADHSRRLSDHMGAADFAHAWQLASANPDAVSADDTLLARD